VADTRGDAPGKRVRAKLPTKPIRFIVGPADALARVIGQQITLSLGAAGHHRPARGGAARFQRGSGEAAPDGLHAAPRDRNAHDQSEHVQGFLRHGARLRPVTLLASTPFILAVHPSVPANSVGELIKLAKSKPGALNYGSGGSGTPPHLATELFKTMAA